MAAKKKLMILGASYSQLPLIAAAKRMGVTALVASIPGDYPGFAEADETVFVDISDERAVLEAAMSAKTDGIATCCMDIGTRALGYVCETMGLPGMSILAAEASCNKYLEKQAYLRSGVNTARFFRVQSEEELETALGKLKFPVMVKAVDLMGSRGIFRSDSREEALENYRKTMEATQKDYCIVEEFLEGEMFGVEAMVSKGELAYFLMLGNEMLAGNPPFPIGHYVPWEHAGTLYGKVREQISRAVDALGFDNCPLDFDCMLMDGEVFIIEATGRAGATCIADTVGIYYGIDYFEAIVRVALGMDVRELFPEDHVGTPSVTRLLSADEAGVVERIEVPRELPGNVVDLSFNIGAGSRVRAMSNGADRIGQLVVKGQDLGDCYRELETVLGGIHVILKDR